MDYYTSFVHFYGIEFESVILLNLLLVLVWLHMVLVIFNHLGANGQGKALRNSSFYVGISMMLFNLLFIPKWGEKGAAYAKLITGFVYLVSILVYYFRFINNNKLKKSAF